MIALGNNEIGKAYIGETEIDKMYLGEELVFSSGPAYDAQVEYLSCSGAQYIDTNIIPDSTTQFVIDGRYTVAGLTDNNNGIMASNNGRFHIGIYNRYFHFGVRSGWKNVVVQDTVRHTFELYGNGIAKLDGTSYTISTSAISTQSISLYLFARNNGSSISYNNYFEVYSCQIYKNDNLVRNFIPVRKENEGYMYDAVSKKLFKNLGTGAFGLGNDIT